MLVNMTLQTDVERLETFVDAMSSNLEELKKQYCGAEPIPDGPRILDELNCDWEEYTQIENYLNRVKYFFAYNNNIFCICIKLINFPTG